MTDLTTALVLADMDASDVEAMRQARYSEREIAERISVRSGLGRGAIERALDADASSWEVAS